MKTTPSGSSALDDETRHRVDCAAIDAARAQVIRSSTTAMAIIGPDGVILDANPSLCRLLNREPADLVGQPMLASLVPERREEVTRWLERCVAGDIDPIHMEDGFTTTSGRHRWFVSDGQAVLDDDGHLAAVTISIVESSATDAAAESRWRTLVQNISDTVTVIGPDGRIMSTTGQMAPVLGYPADSWAGRHWDELVHPDDIGDLEAIVARVLEQPGEHIATNARLRHFDGGWVDVWASAVNLLDDASVGGVLLTTRNITDQKRAESLVASQASILELIARGMPVDDILEAIAAMVEQHDEGAQAAVLLVDGQRLRPRARAGHGPGPVLSAALGEVEVTPQLHATLSGPHGVPFVRFADHPDLSEAMRPAIVAAGIERIWWAPVVPAHADEAVAAIVSFHRDRRPPTEHALRAAEIACTLVAIALDRHATVSELAHRELHDALTGLPNRTLLLDRLQTSLDREHRVGSELGILYVDLDRFKMVNDSFGLTGGDEVLVAVADRLVRATRPGDTVARVGADEFVVVCDRQGRLSTVLAVADRLTESLDEPFPVPGGEVVITASLGLALSTPGIEATTLVRQADAAMLRAKQRGRNRVEMYDPAMQAHVHHRLTLASDLRQAVRRDELRMVYQPVVDLETGVIVGAEALCRWDHPVRGPVPPDEFIPVAEETGAIAEIGPWTLDRALSDLAPLAGGSTDFQLSVNLSARQLDDPDLGARVTGALDAHGWRADQLCLELTETALTDDLDLAAGALLAIRATGVRVAIDDFGTGYSSLTHLQRLPIDAVKVDQSFVRGLGERGAIDRATIVGAVVGIATAMGLEAVAEGIETDAQLRALNALGCAQGQGHLFSPPVPPGALIALVRDQPWSSPPADPTDGA